MNILVDLGRAAALRASDHELLTLARRLADGGIVSVLTHVPLAEGLAEQAGAFGVSRVFVPTEAAEVLSAPDTDLLQQALEQTKARLVLGTSGSDVTEWFGRLSARTGAAVVTDAVSDRPALTEASVVVAGGRGLDGDFSLVEQLADELGGAVGASRAATDAGWIDHSAQIGQTGVTVSPQLFISVGISGAIQQKAGMQTSRVIVAVNKDEDAQVFEIADFGVVGDLNTVLPQAIEELKRRRS